MALRGETTHDQDPPRVAETSTPRLLLLFSGTSLLRKPFPIEVTITPRVLGRTCEGLHPRLGSDNRMSREHAEVRLDAKQGETYLRDLQSRNGTHVNGLATTGTVLRDGDVVRLGNSLFLFRTASEPAGDGPTGRLLGVSPGMMRLRHTLSRVAPTSASILFLGETGSGKEVAARHVHDLSRSGRPFVAVNCTAIPDSLAESQLFGHTKGSFTGATSHPGFFRSAGNGTLLLDEIGDLSESLQPKLLRVLEERLVFPVGSVVGHPLEARLLFSTNRNLLDAVRAGTFRADLYSRIAEVVVDLPPLRERREDLFLLLQHGSHIEPTLHLPPSLAERMLLHSWPFNVRELVKLAAELSATGDSDAVEARLRSQKPLSVSTSVSKPSPVVTDARHRQMIELLQSHKGNVAKVARDMGCPRKNIYRWMDELNLDPATFRE